MIELLQDGVQVSRDEEEESSLVWGGGRMLLRKSFYPNFQKEHALLVVLEQTKHLDFVLVQKRDDVLHNGQFAFQKVHVEQVDQFR